MAKNDDKGRAAVAQVKVERAQEQSQLVLVQAKAEIETQITTAKQYPRELPKFRAALEQYIRSDLAVAQACFYALPRAGKTIIGPSIRFAEAVANTWGNIAADTEPVAVDHDQLYARARCRDLQTNVAFAHTASRRILDSKGKRYGVDMIQTTMNAACSIALRNCILKVVPGLLWRPYYELAREIAVGGVETLAKRAEAALMSFQKMGVPPAQVLWKLGKGAPEEIDLQDVELLLGLYTGIRDGEIDIDQAFAADGQAQPAAPTPAAVAQATVGAEQQPQAAGDTPPQQTPVADEQPAGQQGDQTPPDLKHLF